MKTTFEKHRSTVPTMMGLLALLCLAPMSMGQEKKGGQWILQGENRPQGKYLSFERAEALAKQLREVKITDCRESDLTPLGLLELMNRNLKAAHFSERIYNDEMLEDDLGYYIQHGDVFGVYGDGHGKLNLKNMLVQINHGSVYDLVENFRTWTSNIIGCYTGGIYIGWGQNWPYLLSEKDMHHLEFVPQGVSPKK
jgi:hypothetical protein